MQKRYTAPFTQTFRHIAKKLSICGIYFLLNNCCIQLPCSSAFLCSEVFFIAVPAHCMAYYNGHLPTEAVTQIKPYFTVSSNGRPT